MVTYYKFLDADGKGRYSGFAWPLPQGDEPGAWVEVTGAIVPCENGLHAIEKVEDLSRWVNVALYELEYDGEVVDAGGKVVGRRARLIRRLPAWDVQALRRWAFDCAEGVLPLFEERRPGDNRVRACIETGRRYLAGEATRRELMRARSAAADAAAAAAAYAAYAAAAAAAAAAYAAYAAAAAAAAAADAAAAAAAYAAYAAYAADAAAYAHEQGRQRQGERLMAYANGQVVTGEK